MFGSVLNTPLHNNQINRVLDKVFKVFKFLRFIKKALEVTSSKLFYFHICKAIAYTSWIYGPRYSRMDQVKVMEDGLPKLIFTNGLADTFTANDSPCIQRVDQS